MSSTRKFLILLGVWTVVYAVVINDWWASNMVHYPPEGMNLVDRVVVGVDSILLSITALVVVTGVLFIIAVITGLDKSVKRMVWRRRFKQYFDCMAPRIEQEGQLLQSIVYDKLRYYADRFRELDQRERKTLGSAVIDGEADAVLRSYRQLRAELLWTKQEFWAAHRVASQAPGITVLPKFRDYC